MSEEGVGTPSLYNIQKGYNKNLCVSGEDAEQVSEESWSMVVFENWQVRVVTA